MGIALRFYLLTFTISWLMLGSLAGLGGRVRWVLIGSLGLPLVIAVTHVVLYRLTVDLVSLSTDPP